MVRASIGTLTVLGLRDIRMDAVPTTAYLMIGGRCSSDCAYCGQGRSVAGDHSWLSRISWPEVGEDQLIAAFVAHPGAFQRVCFQTTASREVFRQLLSLVPRIHQASGLPVSVSYRVTRDEEAKQLFDAGVERIGVAIDCCSERLYPAIRGGSLADAKSLVRSLAERYPGRVTTHLIIGLGEHEMEAAELMLEMHHAGVLVSLFAFTPIQGTQMEHESPPPLPIYRKLQFLLGLLDWQDEEHFCVAYDAKNGIHSFGLNEAQMRSFLNRHFLFVTHGCPGCNRPFYTEVPGGTMFNFPNIPAETAQGEIDQFIQDLKTDGFEFAEGQNGEGEGSLMGDMLHYVGDEESLSPRLDSR